MRREQVADKWGSRAAGGTYATSRFGSGRARDRDGRLLTALAHRIGAPLPWGRVLDVPCGTGRLQSVLAALASEQLAIDVSGGMLAQSGQPWRLQASAFRLPLIDASFDAVICCRLMHHLHEDTDRLGLLRELLRVTRGPVLLSFWDAGSWHAWRRRHGLRKVRNEDGRQAMPRRHLAELVEQAGGRVLAWRHSMRGISQQTWVAIEARGARP